MTCKICSQELASLRAYIEQLGTLREVKAPEDFLEKIHARLKRRFEFEKIMRKVFFPVRIKLPLQLVTIAAMLFLVISVSNISQRRNLQGGIAQAPRDSERIIMTKKSEEKPIELARKLDFDQQSAEPKDIREYDPYYYTGSIKERKPIELALSIKPEPSVEFFADTRVQEEVAKQKAILGQDIEVAAGIAKSRSAAAPVAANAVALPLTEALLSVDKLIKLAEGKIIAVEYEQETNQPQFVNAEIPAKNFSTLLEKLGQLGRFQEPLPALAMEGEGLIPIRIKLTP